MSTVIYVAVVEGDQNAGYSAHFPDLPGCVTGADTMVELLPAARDALSLHLQGMEEDGDVFPEPTALEDIKRDPEVKDVAHILVDADVEDVPVRVNISIGAQFLKRLDAAADVRGMSRSGFLVEAARAAMSANAVEKSASIELAEAMAILHALEPSRAAELASASTACAAAAANAFGSFNYGQHTKAWRYQSVLSAGSNRVLAIAGGKYSKPHLDICLGGRWITTEEVSHAPLAVAAVQQKIRDRQ